MAYPKESKEDILSRFHASGMSMRAACGRFDDFPCAETLSKFVSEQEAGLLHPPALEAEGRCEGHQPWEPYPLKTKREALRLLAGGMKAAHVAKRLGISSAGSVRLWASKLAGMSELDARSHPDAAHEKAATLFLQGLAVVKIAEQVGVDARTVYRWLDKAGICRRRTKMRNGTERMVKEDDSEAGAWTRAWGTLPEGDPEERARVAEVRLAEALAVLDVLKAPGPGFLRNTEKYRAGERAKAMTPKATMCDVLADFCIAKSTYFSQGAIGRKADKYAALRKRVKAIFEESKRRYGSERIWAKLRQGEGEFVSAAALMADGFDTPVKVSEKVIRDIMRAQNLVPVQVRHDSIRYSPYKGEVEDRPENLPLCEDGTHDFHADAPGRLVVTDVTEFKLDGGKVYLSPVIDCYDGCPVSWSISTHPNDDLTAGSLQKALPHLEKGCGVHTDGGINYFSNRWKQLCRDSGLRRSMSRKAKSPDNARAEGFFGTLKQEFFYARQWRGIKIGRFIKLLNDYIVWYRDVEIKKSLGWKTIAAHRAALADAA